MIPTLDSFETPYEQRDSEIVRASVVATVWNTSDSCIVKVESGIINVDDSLILMPFNTVVRVRFIKDLETN